jgi:hypothetical protein
MQLIVTHRVCFPFQWKRDLPHGWKACKDLAPSSRCWRCFHCRYGRRFRPTSMRALFSSRPRAIDLPHLRPRPGECSQAGCLRRELEATPGRQEGSGNPCHHPSCGVCRQCKCCFRSPWSFLPYPTPCWLPLERRHRLHFNNDASSPLDPQLLFISCSGRVSRWECYPFSWDRVRGHWPSDWGEVSALCRAYTRFTYSSTS